MKRFIIVDDELLVRVGLRSLADWDAEGYKLIGEAAEGEEALELVRKEQPDIVVTDLVMPGMGGLELIKKLRELQPHIGIVVLSCHNDFESAREALRLGADDYVFKLTLKSSELLEAFDRSLAKHGFVDGREPEKSVLIHKNSDSIELLIRALLKGEDRLELSPLAKLLPLRILAFELLGDIEDSDTTLDILRELSRNDTSVITYLKWEGIFFLGITNGGRPSLMGFYENLNEYMLRYLDASVVAAYSPLITNVDSFKTAFKLTLDTLSFRSFGVNKKLAFAEESVEAIPYVPEAYASACAELSRALDAYSVEWCIKTLSTIAASLGSVEASHRLRLKFSDALVPFRLRARLLGFELDSVPSLAFFDSKLTRARTIQEAVQIATEFVQVFIPYALVCVGSRKEIMAVRRWVLSDLQRNFTVEEAARIAGWSESHFAHIFKDEIGTSFIDFVNRCRIERAQELLQSTDLRVKEIADQVGIDNPNYFCALFKKIIGKTPNELRDVHSRLL